MRRVSVEDKSRRDRVTPGRLVKNQQSRAGWSYPFPTLALLPCLSDSNSENLKSYLTRRRHRPNFIHGVLPGKIRGWIHPTQVGIIKSAT